MIVFEKFGHTFKIMEDDWKNLRERFNPANAIKSWHGWGIQASCSLCDKYDSYCEDCPISSFHSFTNKENQASCGGFLNKLFPKKKFEAGKYSVTWDIYDNTSARRQLNRLQRIMDEIENNQKENQYETKEKLIPRR